MKDKMAIMDKWLEEAMAEGNEAAKAHLNAIARIVGGQVARLSKPDDVPQTIAKTVEEMGKGVTAGMLMRHGSAGVMHVELLSLSRGGR
ncbi:hypothetical protein [Cohnella cellulosilytica]|uniref:Uncharacterized protein n=1 Tax=Cohnella cellulosilytica TaxID=986710 RepID=A0ABW2FH42_9BACL